MCVNQWLHIYIYICTMYVWCKYQVHVGVHQKSDLACQVQNVKKIIHLYCAIAEFMLYLRGKHVFWCWARLHAQVDVACAWMDWGSYVMVCAVLYANAEAACRYFWRRCVPARVGAVWRVWDLSGVKPTPGRCVTPPWLGCLERAKTDRR